MELIKEKTIEDAYQETNRRVASEVVQKIKEQVTQATVYAAIMSARIERGTKPGKLATFVLACTPFNHDVTTVHKMIHLEADQYLRSIYDASEYTCKLDTSRSDCGYLFLDLFREEVSKPVPSRTINTSSHPTQPRRDITTGLCTLM